MKLNIVKKLKENPFVLAPMDAVTDIAFRELCEESGAGYTSTELTSVDALIHNVTLPSRYARGNLKLNSVQLFGSKPENFVKALDWVENEADIIDINFGCPSPSLTKNNCGSALLKDPKQVSEIISALVKRTKLPITAKIRLGYKKKNVLEIAKEIEDAGASAIAVHGRTASQLYSGKADWTEIAKVHENLSIPVIGNGDISKEEDIDEHLGIHAQGLMIGRAAVGNPLLFTRFNHYLKTKEKLLFDRKTTQKELFEKYLKKLDGREFHNLPFKVQQQAMCFMKGIDGASKLRERIAKEKNIDEIIKLVRDF